MPGNAAYIHVPLLLKPALRVPSRCDQYYQTIKAAAEDSSTFWYNEGMVYTESTLTEDVLAQYAELAEDIVKAAAEQLKKLLG